jgi:predicted ATP-dependent serine protease
MADSKAGADRGKAVEAALLNIEKKFGKGSIMRLGEREVSDIPAISTTSLSIDAATGVGGVPRGRVIEIFGPESSGKTTLALHIVAEAQKAGGVAAYIDAEHAMDSDYAGKLGVNIEIFLVAPTSTDARLRMVAERASGFIYAVSRAGVTGARTDLSTEAEKLVGRVRQFSDLPIAVGFGISNSEHVAEVWRYADAAVIGSAIVAEIERNSNSLELVSRIGSFARLLLPPGES